MNWISVKKQKVPSQDTNTVVICQKPSKEIPGIYTIEQAICHFTLKEGWSYFDLHRVGIMDEKQIIYFYPIPYMPTAPLKKAYKCFYEEAKKAFGKDSDLLEDL